MKLILRSLVAAVLLLTPVGVAVAQTAPIAPLAPGEVLLQISASGSSTNRADSVTIFVPISTSADTASAARAANRAKIDILTKALVARGVPSSAVSLGANHSPFPFMGNEAAGVDGDGPSPFPRAKRNAESVVQISLNDPAMFAAVRDVLDEENEAMMGAPVYALKNNAAARATAISDAMSKAREEASHSAAALGLQVARIVRVSNYGAQTTQPEDLQAVARMVMAMQGGSSDQVETQVRIWIDFVLTPR